MCQNMNCKDMCCKSELNLRKLCADCIKAECISSQGIQSCDVCANSVEVKNLFAENEIANNICASGMIQASQSWADKSYANSLCATSANFGSACINNLNVGNINYCVKWRAAVTVSDTLVYNLGSNINWNAVLDDPNSNVALAPFSYTVPNSGYYQLTFYLNSDTLISSVPISGIPVGLLTIFVNGSELRQFNAPFLSFTNIQYADLSALVLLNAGDVITMNYQVRYVDPILGLTSVVGTVNINGNGKFPDSSGFDIHYLSSLNCQSQMCPSCPQVSIPCTAFTTPCAPCDDMMMGARQANAEQSPCDSCQ